MTPSPSVTWPSPAMTTAPLRRTQRTVVDRIRRFVGMRAILDYNSAFRRGTAALHLRASPTLAPTGVLLDGNQWHSEQGGEDANRFPGGEAFMQDDSRQQYGNDGIEGAEDYSGIES